MIGMFENCRVFNQPLESWNVSSVMNMDEMFAGCKVFNQLLEKWDISSITTMYNMFDIDVSNSIQT